MNIEHLIGAFFALSLAGTMAFNYLLIRNTKGPQERRFVIRASIASWLGLILFDPVDACFPRLHLSAVAGILVLFSFACVRRWQLAIRAAEAANS